MRILAIDIGTGTQDILLFDTSIEVENCLQLVMPSPTVLVANQIKDATSHRTPVLLTGSIMGGGPSAWAAEGHVRAGYDIYATPEAAKSFNDELDQVEKSGIRIVGDDEARGLDAQRIVMHDVDLGAIEGAFRSFGVDLVFDALAVGVFDHGNAPPGYSDRLFRFEFMSERIRAAGKLSGFAFMREEIPQRLTRMKAVSESLNADAPLLLMDTAPAAVLGALDDDTVRSHRTAIIANLGNFHTLAFRFDDGAIAGVFEHHTGELAKAQLEGFIEKLADATLTHESIYNSQGHGALLFDNRPIPLEFLAITGPRRGVLRSSRLNPYFAVPYGDMMLAGDFGLVHAYADLNPEVAEEIEAAFAKSRDRP